MAYGGLMGASAPGTYTTDEILSDATKAEYGLGNDAVPNDVFGLLTGAVSAVSTNKFFSGYWTGNGQLLTAIQYETQPLFLLVMNKVRNVLGFFITDPQDLHASGNMHLVATGSYVNNGVAKYSDATKRITLPNGFQDSLNQSSQKMYFFAILS